MQGTKADSRLRSHAQDAAEKATEVSSNLVISVLKLDPWKVAELNGGEETLPSQSLVYRAKVKEAVLVEATMELAPRFCPSRELRLSPKRANFYC